jgi:TetR/AcrR family transcriptional repressor of lmrAB and yxaGH operons
MTVAILIGKLYPATMSDEIDSKQKTILAAAKLLRRQGYAGTALSDILAAAGSPRGSLYFHFPKGKEEIGAAALTMAGEAVRTAIAGAATTSKSAEEFVVRIGRGMAADLEKSNFTEGCPIAPTALEVSGQSEVLTAAARGAFLGWQREIAAGLERFGWKPEQADALASAIFGQLEGALLLARTYGNIMPMHHAEETVKLLARSWPKK